MKKFLTALLTAAVVFTSVAPVTARAAFAGYGQDRMVHSDIPYSEMVYKGYDGARVYAIIEDMEAKRGNAANAQAIIDDYEKIVKELDIFSTQSGLNSVRYYTDVTVQEYADIDLEMSALGTELADAALTAVRDALKSPCGEALKAYLNDPELVDDFLEYEEMTERQHELSVLNTELVQKYDVSSGTDYTITVDGEEWDTARAEQAYAYGEIDAETYYDLTLMIAEERNSVEAGIYAELVKVLKEQAETRGYSNYAEWAYEELYNRDYTTEDSKRLYAYVKKYFVPMQPALLNCFYALAASCYDTIFGGYVMEDEALVDLVEPYIAKVDPHLSEAYDYLKRNHTYEMDILDTKMGIGYTTTFFEYGSPFIFNSADGSYYDVETLIHEFGHYNNAYHNDRNLLTDTTNMDVAEIHSQGLEVLMLEYADEIYGKEAADAVRLAVMYNLIAAVTEGCLYDEFQNEVFAYEGEITGEECNRIFRRLAEEYGYTYNNDSDEAYDWVKVSHTFQSPLYYVSYATSALAALDIFAMAQEDREQGVLLYMDLTTYGLDTSFCELLEKVGLPDIFEEATIERISNETYEYSMNVYKHSDVYRQSMMVIIVIIAVLVAVVAVVVILIVFFVRRSKKKKALLAEQAAAEQAVAEQPMEITENNEEKTEENKWES